MITDSISGSSLLNTSFGTAGATAALSAAGACSIPGGGGSLAAGLIPAARSSCVMAGAGSGDVAGGEVDDFKQLAEVLACSSNKWLREKAAAAVEQLAADDVQACRCVHSSIPSACWVGFALCEPYDAALL
jgi:hypothetical protein